MTQIFVHCNRFNNSEVNEVHIEWTLKKNTRIYLKGNRDKMRTQLTQTALITPTSIHTIKTKHQNKM